ncbi:unnamed protein product [Dimorphilus gyrociliatus]|uniref:Uncharacterized protein n=1 Tax=Dimorphilus gyrociliatus TaxID=2664684 RepID=A0A7I8WEQ1_9ANNE|nr:unnamed protein product [Dimorphilus gyrociliatus]
MDGKTLSRSIKTWTKILEGFQHFEKMTGTKKNKAIIKEFVVHYLINITESMGPDWTFYLDPSSSYQLRPSLYYNFANSYRHTFIADALVDSKSVDEFNKDLNFIYKKGDTSKFIFELVETLSNSDWRKIADTLQEFANLLIENKDTTILKNLKKIYMILPLAS